jgi:protein-tyrosine phosphatase
MVDIHSHILPGVDDGAEDLEEAVAMVKMAAEAGTTDIVATPHADPEHIWDAEAVARGAAALAEASGQVLRIHTGCDFHMTLGNIHDALANPNKYTINHKCYLLVELSDRLVPTATDEVFAQMLAAGIVPVVTHPERNRRLYRRLDRVEKWVGLGARTQVTADSLSGRFGETARAVAAELMRRGLVHFLASDAHGTRDRRPVLDKGRESLASAYGESYAELLCTENPRAALDGSPVSGTRPVPRAKRTWYVFWRR